MSLNIYREQNDALQLIGCLSENGSFNYDSNYLSAPDAQALSFSLPLRGKSYNEDEAKPYFTGLLPEDHALRSLAAELGVAADDYFTLLARSGLDCIGDIIINPEAYSAEASYEPIDLGSLNSSDVSDKWIVDAADVSRLSLAGTQRKIGVFHMSGQEPKSDWFKPHGGAPSNYIVKFINEELPSLMVIEQLVMSCASQCGLNVAKTRLINPELPAIVIERFDRLELSNKIISGMPSPVRRHQEDFAQVLGVEPNSKYKEIEGGTVAAIGRFLDRHSAAPAIDKKEFLALLLFNYAIGNCDNHLKNHSILYSRNWKTIRLAPAYDLVSTTHYARFSQNMGMAIGSTRAINEVEANDILGATAQLNLSPKITQSIAANLEKHLIPALQKAGKSLEEQGFSESLYLADEIEEDTVPRLEVLKKILC